MKNETTFAQLIYSIQAAHRELAAQAGRAVNISLTLRNWLIGYYIAAYELNGKDRAEYGENLLPRLSVELQDANVTSCGKRQLYGYLRFYQTYPQIVRSATALSEIEPQKHGVITNRLLPDRCLTGHSMACVKRIMGLLREVTE